MMKMKRHINTLAALLQQPRSRRPIAQQPPFRQCQLPAAPALALAAALLLAACAEAPEARRAADAATPVTLSVSTAAYTAPTRAALADAGHAGRTFAAGEQLYAYFPEGVSVGHTLFTTGAPAADVNPATAADPQPMLSAPGGTLPVYAYSPATVNELTATWTVAQNQATAERYAASDLMTATGTIDEQGRCKNDAVNGSSADALTLQHQMARIVVSVNAPSAALNLSALQLIAGWRTTGLAMPAGTPAGALTDAISPAEPLTVSSAATIDAGDTQQYCCLVPPQRIAQGTPLVRIVTHQGTATYATATAQQLQAGRSYTLAVSLTAVGVTTGIAAWADGGTLTPGESDEDIYEVNGVTFRMVPVEGGYTATSIDDEGTHAYRENYDYKMGETEASVALWNAVMGTSKTGTAATTVTQVSWNDIMLTDGFLERLNTLTATQRPAGWVFTLPTINQWQYAAAGGRYSHGYKYSGSDTADDVAASQSANQKTLAPNELGLYDMCGHIKEIARELTDSKMNSQGGRSNSSDDGLRQINFVENDHAPSTSNLGDWGFRLALVPTPPVVGDLYFSDGTWGTAADNPGKTPIGIVFSTTTSAADRAAGYLRGYVMALGEVSAANWCNNVSSLQSTLITGKSYNSTNPETQFNNLKGDIDGLTRCNTARKYCTDRSIDESNLTAIMAAVNYTPAAPEASSGWYLPTAWQGNMWRLAFSATFAPYANYSSAWNYYQPSGAKNLYVNSPSNIGKTVVSEINVYINDKLNTAANRALFMQFKTVTEESGREYYTCTEKTGSEVYGVGMLDDSVYFSGDWQKSSSRKVRPVLAF